MLCHWLYRDQKLYHYNGYQAACRAAEISMWVGFSLNCFSYYSGCDRGQHELPAPQDEHAVLQEGSSPLGLSFSIALKLYLHHSLEHRLLEWGGDLQGTSTQQTPIHVPGTWMSYVLNVDLCYFTAKIFPASGFIAL